MALILGISGSPIPNSNIDQTIKATLEATNSSTQFLKLSNMTVRPCVGCLGCASDNHCRQDDDYSNQLESAILEAGALVIGGYPPFGIIDAFTKALLERTYSLWHKRQLLQGKLGVAVAGGYKGNVMVKEYLEKFFIGIGMQHVGTIVTCGNPTCLSCGYGDSCALSNIPKVFGEDAKCSPDKYATFSQRPDLLAEAKLIGNKLGSLVMKC